MGADADVAQLVERDLAKVEVAGSSPVVRSREFIHPGLKGRDERSLGSRQTQGPTGRYQSRFHFGVVAVARRRLLFLAIETMDVVKGR